MVFSKKALRSFFLVICMLAVLLPVIARPASAAEYTSNGYTYSIQSGVASIKKYGGKATSITVPTEVTYNGVRYKISEIQSKAFADCTTLRSVTIPAEITKIGPAAFKNCTALTSLTIHGDLADCSSYSSGSGNSSSYSVFYNAGRNGNGITVTFGPKVTRIPAYLFATGEAKTNGTYARIKKVVIPDSVVNIGAKAFLQCFDLAELSLGSGVDVIDRRAFEKCESLTTVVLPASVTQINNNAFTDCIRLKYLTINGNTALAVSAFKNCTGLTNININGNLADCNSRSADNTYASEYAVFYNAGRNTDGITVTFGPKVTRIPAYLFASGSNKASAIYARIKAVIIHPSIVSVQRGAFAECYDLQNVYSYGSSDSWYRISFERQNEYFTDAHKTFDIQLGVWQYVDDGWYCIKFDGTRGWLSKSSDGNWYYYEGFFPNTSYTGLGRSVNGWYYINKGKVDYSYTGLAQNSYGWFYTKNGKVDFTYTGLAKGPYGWYYVKNGKVDYSYTGLAKSPNGWYYAKNGKVDYSYTGLAKSPNGWYYTKNGKVDYSYTGLAKSPNGWYYAKNGKVDYSYTGLAKSPNGWYYAKNGKVDYSFTGIAESPNGWYYTKNGKVDYTYNGYYYAYGAYYYIVNGKVMP